MQFPLGGLVSYLVSSNFFLTFIIEWSSILIEFQIFGICELMNF